jgi:predicted ATPase/DNA-binding NarL/FixJ family response regulator
MASARSGCPPVKLPVPVARLIGRDEELASLRALLRVHRLVTISGPPGVGKTRLAMAAASAVAEDYLEGALFVDLAGVRDPDLVLAEIANALGVGDAPGESVEHRLAAATADREILLVVDNFEHVLEAARALARILSVSPGLRVLVTSRERLHLLGEREFSLSPLSTPDPDLSDLDRLAACPSVILLGERSGLPDFAVTQQNARAVADVCLRLDGLPLAIELAAARLKVFSPEELLTRIARRLELLTDGAQDTVPRHRALRAAIDWSHDLLPARERLLFRRLSVFAGGWTLVAAERVCADLPVLDALGSLLDKSLIGRTTRADGTAGFAMLESIREYAAEQLDRCDSAEAIRARHAAYYAERAVAHAAGVAGPDEMLSYAWVSEEHGNLRAALADRRAAGDLVRALQLASSLSWYWYTRGHLGEAKTILNELLSAAATAKVPDDTLANALISVGFVATARGELDYAERSLTEGRALCERVGLQHGLATAALCLGHVARGRHSYEEAAARYTEAASLFTELAHEYGLAWAIHDLGMLAGERGDAAEAEHLLRESLRRARDLAYPWALAWSAWGLSTVLMRGGAVDAAASFLCEGLHTFDAVDDRRGVAQCLEAFAELACTRAAYRTAARLLGAAAVLRQAVSASLSGDELEHVSEVHAVLTEAIGPDAADRAWREGRAMGGSTAVALALSLAAPVPAPASIAAGTVPLTTREQQVAALVAGGSTNRQIARALDIAEKTVEAHVHNIMGKLSVPSRAGVAAWAVARGLFRPDP